MNILFLHLSDLHIKSEAAISKINIDKIIDTLRLYRHIDSVILVFSGDIAFSGASNQYNVATSIIDMITEKLSEKNIFTGQIEVLCVPGNHDIEYEEPARTSSELNEIYDSYTYASHLEGELKKQINYFNFSSQNKCFENPSVFNRRILRIGEFSIEVNMINSAVFSLKHSEDKGLHYIDQSAINELNTPTGADFVISVMHHAPDWYIDTQKNQIETALFCKSSLIFLGHEHKSGTKSCSYNDEAATFIHAGGSLCNDSDWTKSEFEAGMLSTDTFMYTVNLFKWNSSERQYESVKEITRSLPHKPSIEKTLEVTKEFKAAIMSSSHPTLSDTFLDYYVFPRIESETYDESTNNEFVAEDQFISELLKQRRVLITGSSNCGKTTLLKFLFLKLIDAGKCVILCDIDTIKKRNSSKIVKTNFEEIYGSDYSDYNRFSQLAPEEKVLIIDDVDQIIRQDFELYISEQSSQFGLMIFSTRNVIDLDMLNRMSTALKTNDSLTKYSILPFYADKRKELIQKTVSLKSMKDPSISCDETIEALCKALKLQKRYISLEPDFIINFVEYYCNNLGTLFNSDSSVFSKVFESDITNSLSPYKTKEISIEKLYKLLSMLAYHIHFNKCYPVSESEIIDVVNNYNKVFDDIVRPSVFIDIVCSAKLLTVNSDGYKFHNKNHLAYFCAREVNFIYNDSGNEEPLKYLINYCCFGINADILMFISYITDNTKVLRLFLNMTRELTATWEEFDFNSHCPKFLKLSSEPSIPLPTLADKQEEEKAEVIAEIENNEELQTIDIYDYNEIDANKTNNQIVRALSLMTIISKCLPSFEHNMAAEMRKDFVKEIYTLPNKIYGLWAEDVDSIYDELISYLKSLGQNDYHCQKYLEQNEVEIKFRLVAAVLLLDIYNIAVNYATRDNSFRLLDRFDRNRITYQIQNLMMVEQQKLSDRFVQDSISLYKDCKRNLPKFLVTNVVQHAYINMGNLNHSMLNRLETNFFQAGSSGKKKAQTNRKALLLKRNKGIKKDR